MSLYCPQCDGLVYARSNRKCGHCGAPLPPEFAFSEAEQQAEIERTKAVIWIPKPKFSILVLTCWIVTSFGWLYLTITNHGWHRWINLLLAVLNAYVIVEHLLRYRRNKNLYETKAREHDAGLDQLVGK